jgi:cell division protein FtsB
MALIRNASISNILVGRFFGPLFVVAALFYFGFHAMNGDRGIFALIKEQRKLELTLHEIEVVSKQRRELEHKTRLLSSSSLDLDLLDEQARSMLGYTAPGEDVILLESN